MSARNRSCLRLVSRCLAGVVALLTLRLFTLSGSSAEAWVTKAEALSIDGGGRIGFTLMDSDAVGVRFTNELSGDMALTNAVAHNGAGLAIGDVDGDGWPDLYFCSLQGPNRLYLNRKNWRFEEVDAGPASCGEDLSTAAVLVDADGDRDLDLLVNGIAAGTRLFLNDGRGRLTESADSGLSRSASPMSMALADIDGDGDLDLYCTHYIDVMHLADPTTRFALARRGDQWEVAKVNGESARAAKWKDRFQATADGKVRELPEAHALYRNEGNGRFVAIQDQPGTFLDEQGKPIPPYRDWGLSVMFRDLNRDGAPDFYVCNDNASPDRVWINTGSGSFRPVEPGVLRHTSRSSMGLDFADIDRDGLDDFLVVDMLARDHTKRMTQLVREHPDRAERERSEDRPRFGRNTLFRARPDGTYAEIALLAGVAASDWSWCPMFLDVDLDGFEDLLITTGFAFDVMDQDSNDQMRLARLPADQLKRFRRMHPGWPTPKVLFRNRRDGTFEAAPEAWGFREVGISYGMAAGDLDGDGDLDVVVNTLNGPARLYRNDSTLPRVLVRLVGQSPNTHGIGARVSLASKTITQSQDIIAGGRYLSGDESVRVFAAGQGVEGPLTLTVRWPGGAETSLGVQPNHRYEVAQSASNTARVRTPTAGSREAPYFADATASLGFRHTPAPFDEGMLQPLLPRRLSTLGPPVLGWDVNGDGWEDLVIGGGRAGGLLIYTNQAGQGFGLSGASPAIIGDGTAVQSWTTAQGARRLLMARSNYELPRGEPSEIQAYDPGTLATPRRWSAGLVATGPLAVADVDGDGDLDLFVGGRSMPGRYPEPVSSMIWLNDGDRLQPDEAWSRALNGAGMVTGATFADLDSDGDADLALSTEWGTLRIFRNQKRAWEEVTSAWGFSQTPGLWQCLAVGDFDEDGRLDLAAGNWGLNSGYALTGPGPHRLFYGDWDQDGRVEVVEAWKQGERWMPVADRKRLSTGFPEVQHQFPTHAAFAAASVDVILGSKYQTARWVEVSSLESAVFLNRGDRWERRPLPQTAQLTPAMAMAVGDFDGDGHEDLFLAQNFLGGANEWTRDDAGQGLWLRGDGKGGFAALESSASGIRIDGEQRGAALVDFNHDGRIDLAVSQHDGPARLFLNQRARPGLRVTLQGSQANPASIGTQLRLVYAGQRLGPARAVVGAGGAAGTSTWVLGLDGLPDGIQVRWPDGHQETRLLSPETREITITRK